MSTRVFQNFRPLMLIMFRHDLRRNEITITTSHAFSNREKSYRWPVLPISKSFQTTRNLDRTAVWSMFLFRVFASALGPRPRCARHSPNVYLAAICISSYVNVWTLHTNGMAAWFEAWSTLTPAGDGNIEADLVWSWQLCKMCRRCRCLTTLNS